MSFAWRKWKPFAVENPHSCNDAKTGHYLQLEDQDLAHLSETQTMWRVIIKHQNLIALTKSQMLQVQNRRIEINRIWAYMSGKILKAATAKFAQSINIRWNLLETFIHLSIWERKAREIGGTWIQTNTIGQKIVTKGLKRVSLRLMPGNLLIT